MRTAKEIASEYNRYLLKVLLGEDSEYESLSEILDHPYDWAYIVQQGRNVGVYVLLAGGGPTVWLNTYDGMLYASDSGDCAGIGLFSDVRDEINDFFGIEY